MEGERDRFASSRFKLTQRQHTRNGGNGGGGGGDDTGIDPAIVGLLKRLPKGGTPMTAKRRKALIDAFTNLVEFIYPDVEDAE